MSGLSSCCICFLALFNSDSIAPTPPGLRRGIVGSINTTIGHRGALVREGPRLRLAAAARPVGISPQLNLSPLHPIVPIVWLLNIGPTVRLLTAATLPILLFIIVNLRNDRPPTIVAPRRGLLEESIPGPERAEHGRTAHRSEHARATHRPEEARAEHPRPSHPAPERLREERVVERIPAPEQAGHGASEGGEPAGAESGERVPRAAGDAVPLPSVPPSLHFPATLGEAASAETQRPPLARSGPPYLR